MVKLDFCEGTCEKVLRESPLLNAQIKSILRKINENKYFGLQKPDEESLDELIKRTLDKKEPDLEHHLIGVEPKNGHFRNIDELDNFYVALTYEIRDAIEEFSSNFSTFEIKQPFRYRAKGFNETFPGLIRISPGSILLNQTISIDEYNDLEYRREFELVPCQPGEKIKTYSPKDLIQHDKRLTKKRQFWRSLRESLY